MMLQEKLLFILNIIYLCYSFDLFTLFLFDEQKMLFTWKQRIGDFLCLCFDYKSNEYINI